MIYVTRCPAIIYISTLVIPFITRKVILGLRILELVCTRDTCTIACVMQVIVSQLLLSDLD